MRTGKVILILLLVILLSGAAAGFWFYQQSKKLQVRTGTRKDFKLMNLTDLVFNQELILKNFSSANFTVNQVYVEVWTPDLKTKLAESETPLQQNVKVPARLNEPVNIMLKLASLKLIEEARRQGMDFQDVLTIVLNAGQAGFKLRLRGYVVANGIKSNLDEEITL